MRIANTMRVFVALPATALPWLERDLQVLPVSGSVREEAWLAATFALSTSWRSVLLSEFAARRATKMTTVREGESALCLS